MSTYKCRTAHGPSYMSRHHNDMWLSGLPQVALLWSLQFVGTLDGDKVKDAISTSETCKKYEKTCPEIQHPKSSRRMLQESPKRTDVRRVCYITLPYYPKPDNYTAHLCTHLIAGFVKTLPNGTMKMVRDSDPKQYRDLLDLRSCNPHLKVLVTTGINNYNNRTDSTNFSVLINTTDGRRTFVDESVKFLRQHGFDGLDLDWEYPGHYKNNLPTNNASGDKANFALLLKDLHDAYRNRSYPGYCGDLLLSVPVSATQSYIDAGYDIRNISMYADLVNLMCYNYHLYQPYRNYTRHNSPLFRNDEELKDPRMPDKDKPIFEKAYVNWTVQYLLKLELDKSKLNVGLPVFGRTFTLANASDHDFLAPATGPGPGSGNGFVEYYWVCQFVKQNNTTPKYDAKIVAPYAYNSSVWVAYNEEKAIRAKVNWTVSNNYGGVMTYPLNFDDVNNTCKDGHYPIHTLIRDLLRNLTMPSGKTTN